MNMQITFTKMQACGNDFIVIDDRAGRLIGLESELARRVCPIRLALGADGLLILRNGLMPGHFGMVFVNANGLIGEMCGNGARCLAGFIRRAGLAQNSVVLDTGAGEVPVRFPDAKHIMLTLAMPSDLRPGLTVSWQGRDWIFDALTLGPPHVVCLLDSLAALEALDVPALGRFVREHSLFAPRGCNVNFAASHQGRLHLRTYERGVEDETLGCGTGATATVLVARQRLGPTSPQTVVTRSGELLQIDMTDSTALHLHGDAHFVADGQLAPELLQGLFAHTR